MGGAVVAVVAFRAGLLPGGLVAVDVLLAVVGWWSARHLVSGRATVVDLLRRGFSAAWPGATAALVLALGWVLTTASTTQDHRVRGEALGVVTALANWQLLARGPSEAVRPPLVAPLQHVWMWAVLVQVVLAWSLLARVVAARGRRAGGDRLATVSLLFAAAAAAWAVWEIVGGASADLVVFGPATHAVAFGLGAAWGAASPDGALVHHLARMRAGWPVAAALLGLVALLFGPGAEPWRLGIGLVVPVLAAVVVAGLVPTGETSAGAAPIALGPLGPWPVARWLELAVAVLWVHAPVLALAHHDGIPRPVAVVVGVAGIGLIGLVVAELAGRRSSSATAVERRRVLGPPAVALLMIAIFSATGAFHWFGPRPSDPSKPVIPAPSGAVVPGAEARSRPVAQAGR